MASMSRYQHKKLKFTILAYFDFVLASCAQSHNCKCPIDFPGGPLKYNSVHMHDQIFSKTTLNEFLLTDEYHPLNEFT